MNDVLRAVAQVVLGIVTSVCLLAATFFLVFGLIAVAQDLSRGRPGDALATAARVGAALVVPAGLGGLALFGLKRVGRPPVAAKGFEVLPPR